MIHKTLRNMYLALKGGRWGDLDLGTGASPNGLVKVDKLTESTSSAGVTIDSVLLKDGGVTASGTNTLGSTTISTAKTLAVTDADALTEAGIILPKTLQIVVTLQAHASLKTRNLFYATAGYTITSIVYEPEVAEGTGSVVCTVCKVTGNNVAVAATTPMCTAFAVTGTAGTPVVATLTGTAADLVLAATNKIGCIFTGGDEFLDTGSGRLHITMKRS